MQIRLLDLDGAHQNQSALRDVRCSTISATDWGPRIRQGCSFGRFRSFEKALAERFGHPLDSDPFLTFYGSGDFHHVSLALLRRQRTPFNLLILDNHPDWMRRIPFMHCGTWVAHALEMPNLKRVFHVGGDVDFDNSFQPLAPWRELRSGRVVVLPARRTFQGRAWRNVPHTPIKAAENRRLELDRLHDALAPHLLDLRRCPLYISLDKDVLGPEEAVVNWDSGRLCLDDVEEILGLFRELCGDRLAGMDILGDWSPVRTHGLFRRLLHLVEHPALPMTSEEAARVNEATNRRLMGALGLLPVRRRAVA